MGKSVRQFSTRAQRFSGEFVRAFAKIVPEERDTGTPERFEITEILEEGTRRDVTEEILSDPYDLESVEVCLQTRLESYES